MISLSRPTLGGQIDRRHRSGGTPANFLHSVRETAQLAAAAARPIFITINAANDVSRWLHYSAVGPRTMSLRRSRRQGVGQGDVTLVSGGDLPNLARVIADLMRRIVLGWVVLLWVISGWIVLGWVVLLWVILGWIVLGWVVLIWVVLLWVI